MTSQRRAIVETVMRTKGHITPPDIVRRVQRKNPDVNESTVYRALALLEDVGVLSHAHLHGGPAYHHVGAHDHVHLICDGCGKDYYLAADRTREMQRALRRRASFEPDFTHFAIAGTCESCLKKKRSKSDRSRTGARGDARS